MEYTPENISRNERIVDDSPELRVETAKRLTRFLDTTQSVVLFEGRRAEEVLGDEATRREAISHLVAEDYIGAINGINGILRNKRRQEWGFDGEGVVIGDPQLPRWEFPEQEDKEELLKYSLMVAKEMVLREQPTQDIGLMLATAISSIHPHKDGNGRTAKTVLALVNQGYSAQRKPVIEEVITSTEFSNAVNPLLIQGYVTAIIERRLGVVEEGTRTRFVGGPQRGSALELGETVSPEWCAQLEYVLRRDPLRAREALFLYAKPHLEAYASEDGDIDLDVVLADLVDTDIEKIVADWKELKKLHVTVMIDALAKPQKEEFRVSVSPNGDGAMERQSILEVYKAKIARSTDPNLYERVFG